MKEHIFNLLGTQYPLIQAPMAGVQDSKLAIAVSEAGGVGSVPCGMLSIEQIVHEIKAVSSASNKPFNLNFFCHKPEPYDPTRQNNWQKRLQPYFTELGVEFDSNDQQASRMPFSHDIADAIEPFKPPLISFHFGLPSKDLMQRIKGWGGKVISSATTAEEAAWLEANGANGVIAQGLEAGGHRGMFLSTSLSKQTIMTTLLPHILRSVNVPVIAAGGITNNDEVKNTVALGASAVQVGTAYLLCTEATTSDLHRDAIKNSGTNKTAVTNIFSGKPARGIINRAMREVGLMSELAPGFPHTAIEMSQLRRHSQKLGRDDFTPLWCGENTQGCSEVSASVITKQLVYGL
ncbi:2-nitropropane dioxygenase [Pseudoalteromonas citrea]|uniref:Nitronate monooxygenase n=1 Tax=Pseudoalteromonas citrea TaxID=43655 RepID=A0A5S3XTR6_9GAMM|nr:nitronate monooxygenase [Pseudoalteromonas citrea]TMP46040.1 2-nitropropane dioxygenase [Pseudoalteromonas citrea]TMP61947.1 2-nitropropane dioxygenase [Pseudoalteromonas citrea]